MKERNFMRGFVPAPEFVSESPGAIAPSYPIAPTDGDNSAKAVLMPGFAFSVGHL
jgi:hypothetical protein